MKIIEFLNHYKIEMDNTIMETMILVIKNRMNWIIKKLKDNNQNKKSILKYFIMKMFYIKY